VPLTVAQAPAELVSTVNVGCVLPEMLPPSESATLFLRH